MGWTILWMVLLGVACKEWLALCSLCSSDYKQGEEEELEAELRSVACLSPVVQLKPIFHVRGGTALSRLSKYTKLCVSSQDRRIRKEIEYTEHHFLTMPVINTVSLCVQEEIRSFF